MSEKHHGSCLCGEISFETDGKPIRSVTCHCTMCQKAAGAPFMTLVNFPGEAVTWTVEPTYHASSDIADRGFCPRCGTALSFRFKNRDNIHITVAAFDDPDAFPPQEHLWTDSKVAWIDITDDVPTYPQGRKG